MFLFACVEQDSLNRGRDIFLRDKTRVVSGQACDSDYNKMDFEEVNT